MANPRLILSLVTAVLSLCAAGWFFPGWHSSDTLSPPATAVLEKQATEIVCNNRQHADWRNKHTIEGITILPSPVCEPDNPYQVAAFVKGTNQLSMQSLMQTELSQDALIKGRDLDGDGDPDEIHIKLEIIELNGSSPDGDFVYPTYPIAPGIKPGLWVFAPKTRGMSIRNTKDNEAIRTLRAPSPVIRVEQGDQITITVENTHYFPHSLHMHGVDHPWRDAAGIPNDGVSLSGEKPIMPGESHTYSLTPRQVGTMFYHCHVQTDKHLTMGLNGMFVIEENRPRNWLQTFNVGAGHVRRPSVAVSEHYDREYDLHYQALDKDLGQAIQQANDPRLIAKAMHRDYDMTDSSEDYFLLNGRSFPYTLRESTLVAKQGERIKLRVANAQISSMALHFHGHKTTATAYDGIELPEAQRITRDVFNIAPAQRLDLELDTTDDGLHSYGAGLWIFHDHVETGISTDGISPGGNLSMLLYEDYMTEEGLPASDDITLKPLFSDQFYAKQRPIWSMLDAQKMGDVATSEPPRLSLIFTGLFLGLAVSCLFFAIRLYRGQSV